MIPSDSIARFCIAAVLSVGLAAGALAQTESSEFGSLKFAPDLDQCRQALAQGNVLKVDGDTYYIYFDVALFVVQVSLDGLKCTAARHINK